MLYSCDQKKYQSWYNSLSLEERSWQKIIAKLWQIFQLYPEKELSDTDIFYLISLIPSLQKKQEKLIYDLCSKRNISYWVTRVSRAGDFLYLICPQLDSLKKNLEGKNGEQLYRYLTRVFQNIIIQCNNKIIKDLESAESNYDDNLMNSSCKEIYQPAKIKTMGEIILEEENRKGAEKLYIQIKQEWSLNKINLLCEYYDKVNGIKTERLKAESENNIYKLHQRLRNDFNELLTQYTKDEIRTFFKLYLPELCQETPPSPTYLYNKKTKAEELL